MDIKEVLAEIESLAERYQIDRPSIVGGVPRDILLGRKVKTTDIDITTGTPDATRLGILLAHKLSRPFKLFDDTHVSVFFDDFAVDFSSNYISSGVLKTIKADAAKYEAFSRDFTINALQQDLKTREIVDPTGMGKDDIEKKVLRTPVDPEITLTDNPKRIFRAVKLAAKYGLTIDPEIIAFIKSNPEISENVNREYAFKQISVGLKSDPRYTMDLLKEMDLLEHIPQENQVEKIAQFIAKNWEDYISQGPAYAELAEYWKDNSQKLPDFNNSYGSWVKWYNENKKDWGGHRGPEEVLRQLKVFLSEAPATQLPLSVEQVQKDPSKFKKIVHKLSPFKVKIKPGADTDNLTQDAKTFLGIVGGIAADLGAEDPVVTSGHRNPTGQARAMAKNWEAHGGTSGGTQYLIDLYAMDDFAIAIGQLFQQYGSGNHGVRMVADFLSKNPISPHMKSPSGAVDFRKTRKMDEVLQEAKKQSEFKMIDEGDHFHVQVYQIHPSFERMARLRSLLEVK